MISVVIPTLDEEKAIGEVVEHVPEDIDGEKTEVYVLDGGSEDNTCDVAEEAGATVIRQQYRGGKGAAMRQALDQIETDIFVFLDGDGTYDPEEMEAVVRPVIDGDAEHVIGSRLENRESGSISLFNLLGNKIFNRMVQWVYGVEVSDILSGYRAMSADSLITLPTFHDGFGIEAELTMLTLDSDARLMEVPITYRRRKGSSKLSPISDGYNILRTIVWMARDTQPMKFFSLVSLVFLLGALYPSYVVIMERVRTGVITHTAPAILASLLFLFALQTFIFGVLADQQKRTQRRIQKMMERAIE